VGVLAALEQAAGEAPVLAVALADEGDRPVGPLDHADRAHRERRGDGAHDPAPHPARQVAEDRQREAVEAAITPRA
jgi:hypothetical protein